MRFRLFTAVATVGLTVAVAVGVSTAGAKTGKPVASAAAATGTAHVIASPDVSTILFDNNNNDAGVGISSQNFEVDFDAFDDAAADDFVVPQNTKWHVKQIVVTGIYYNCSTCGPATSENVTFYTNRNQLPNTVKKQYLGLVGTDNGTGSFVIKFPKGDATTLSGGTNVNGKHYWVSVQANMDFGVGGQWGWETSTNAVGYENAWENPGDGFGTGCTTWGPQSVCIASTQGPSQMFTLKGTHTP